MPISDPRYIVLLIPAVAVFYVLRAGHWRMFFILALSYLYYLTFPFVFFPVLLSITLIAYVGGRLIERADGTPGYKWIVGTSILACFLPMIFYKYIIPLWVDPTRSGTVSWILPVGLSFYTFAAAGYLADVALRIADAERRPLRLAVFCAFFPTVTMGPVMRTTFFDQLLFQRAFDVNRATRGTSEILIGAVLKLWFADSLAVPCYLVYADLSSSSPLEQFVASIFEAFQVYADWLGYSMIAIGSARLLGVDVPDNFRQPYLSTNMGEFWRSWNISLINWLRDYVFTSLRLQLRRWPAVAIPAATFVTFVLLGIWHAAGWGYLIYGAVNGLLVAGSQLTLPARDRFWRSVGLPMAVLKCVRVPVTFTIVVLTIPLVRANSLGDALHIYDGIFSWQFVDNLYHVFVPTAGQEVFRHIRLGPEVLLIIGLIAGDLISLSKPVALFPPSKAVRAAVCSVCILAIVYQAMSPYAAQPFVYFRY